MKDSQSSINHYGIAYNVCREFFTEAKNIHIFEGFFADGKTKDLVNYLTSLTEVKNYIFTSADDGKEDTTDNVEMEDSTHPIGRESNDSTNPIGNKSNNTFNETCLTSFDYGEDEAKSEEEEKKQLIQIVTAKTTAFVQKYIMDLTLGHYDTHFQKECKKIARSTTSDFARIKLTNDIEENTDDIVNKDVTVDATTLQSMVGKTVKSEFKKVNRMRKHLKHSRRRGKRKLNDSPSIISSDKSSTSTSTSTITTCPPKKAQDGSKTRDSRAQPSSTKKKGLKKKKEKDQQRTNKHAGKTNKTKKLPSKSNSSVATS